MNIQWYPGHMTKTRRMIEQDIRQVDIVCEIFDARIPRSSRNPDLPAITAGKPKLLILNRTDQADPAETKRWVRIFRAQSLAVLETDCRSGRGVSAFSGAVREVLSEKLQRYAERGQAGRALKAMVVGIPNVGKSSLINRLTGRKNARTEDRPGVTRGKQWFTIEKGLLLLDTPGILWPKFEDRETGLHLAWTGAIRDEILDVETLSAALLETLAQRYPQALTERYKLSPEDGGNGAALLEQAARKRGFLLRGGVADTERMAAVLLDEFRGGKLGRITLETTDREENP